MRHSLLCLVGPTGSGKTALAIDAIERSGVRAEIVNLDSRQLYRQLAVGTAKPTPEECARVVHHGVDLIDVDEEYDAGRYRAYVEELLPSLWEREVVPLVVGGAGFYLRALREGFFDFDYSAERLSEVRARIQELDDDALWNRLATEDPASAARLHRNDRYRVSRALEILELCGRPMGELAAQFEPRPVLGCAFELFHLSPPREELHRRILARTERWLEGAWQEELRGLLDSGVAPDAPGLQVLGYPTVSRLLAHECDLDAALAEIVVATRRYAKQQETWFRKERCTARGAQLEDALVAALRRWGGRLDTPQGRC